MCPQSRSEYVEVPLVWVLHMDLLSEYCTSCANRHTNISLLKRCTKCKLVHYCSAGCQQQDWPQHKLECARLINSTVTSDDVRLVSRLLDAFVRDPDLKTRKSHGRSYDDLHSMARGTVSNADDARHFAEFYRQYAMFVGDKTLAQQHVLDVFTCYGKCRLNSISVLNTSMVAIGVGLYPSHARFDHACRPNGRFVFNGITAVFTVFDEASTSNWMDLTHSYIDCWQSLPERRRLLEESYHFMCQCRGCTDSDRNARMSAYACEQPGCTGAVSLPDLSNSTSAESSDFSAARCLSCSKSPSKDHQGLMRVATEACRSVIKALQSTSAEHVQTQYDMCTKTMKLCRDVLYRENVDLMYLADNCMRVCLRMQRHDEAFEYGRMGLYVLRCYAHSDDPFWLNRVMQLVKCGLNAKVDLKHIRALMPPDLADRISHSFGDTHPHARLLTTFAQT